MSTEHQQSVNNFRCCIIYNPWAVLPHLPIIKVLLTFMGNIVWVHSSTPKLSVTRASTERQQSVNRASTERQQSVNRASTERQQSINNFHFSIVHNPRAMLPHFPIIEELPTFMGNMGSIDVGILQITVNGVSTILGIAACIVEGLCCCITHNWSIVCLYSQYVECPYRYRPRSGSTQHQRFLMLRLVSCISCATVFTHNRSLGRLDRQFG